MQRAINQMMDNIHMIGMTRPADPRDPIDVLKAELEELTKDQIAFEASLKSIYESSFEDLEAQFREIVMHNGKAQNLLLRAELFSQLEELAKREVDAEVRD